jgi:hypothetical protein
VPPRRDDSPGPFTVLRFRSSARRLRRVTEPNQPVPPTQRAAASPRHVALGEHLHDAIQPGINARPSNEQGA